MTREKVSSWKGIPKRRPNERHTSYRLRLLEAEVTRRREDKIKELESQISEMNDRHRKEYAKLHDEIVRYYRAKPGTKYDRRMAGKRQ